MDSNLTAEKIAELKRLWAAAGIDELHHEDTTVFSLVDGMKDVWFGISVKGNHARHNARRVVIAEYFAALSNAFPDLIAALEAATAERDERTTIAARAQEAMRYLLNGLPATDSIWAAYGNADSARAWLAARDARMKNEGAAEATHRLARVARESEMKFISVEWLQAEAARLAEGE